MRTGEREGAPGASQADATGESGGDSERRLGLARRRRIQRKQSGAAGSARIPEGGGARLPSQVAEPMGEKLGVDLSSVNLHTGGDSGRAASDLGARAFTVGNDVHFGAGQYAPGTKEGDRLLAHELTHVAQGQKSGVQRKAERDEKVDADEVSHPDEPAEKEADATADDIAEEMHEQKPSAGKPAATKNPSAVSKKSVHLAPDGAAAPKDEQKDDQQVDEKKDDEQVDENKDDKKKKEKPEWKQGPEASDEEKGEVVGDMEAALKRYTDSAVWPSEGSIAQFKNPPKNYEELIEWTKEGSGFFFTPQQKDYLYGLCEMAGLLAAAKRFKEAQDTGEQLDPRAMNIVAFALSQVGLVEAQTDSGEREPNPDGGEEIQKCVGADRLWGYHERAGRGGNYAVVKDWRYNIDVAKSHKGIVRDSWCQIFSQWAVTLAGGDASLGVSTFRPTKNPKPGDIGYKNDDTKHMAVVIAAENGQVTTVDANVGLQSGIEVTVRQASWWDSFHDSCPTGKPPVEEKP